MATVAAPLPAVVAAFTVGSRAPRAIGGLGAAAAGLGFLGAVALTVAATRGEPVDAALGPVPLTADRLAVVLLLLVCGVSAVAQAYAVRYLSGDPRAAWFTGGAGLLTFASAGLVTVDTLFGLAFFWTMAGAALCLLLATYWHLPPARDGVRRTVRAFVVGDLALWTAVVVATATWGRIDLRAVEPGQFSGAAVSVVAILVVVAALSRSAQIPFHRWLPATLAAPTPVSALLHAGVVNAGGILLIRLATLTADDAARVLTIVAGAATMAYGGVIMLVKPDVKGALVNSTSAQMGFMILTCGLGLWAAAVIHLVAHGFYKATLFLSSGSAVAAARRHGLAPPARRLSRVGQAGAAVTAVALTALALAVALAVVPLPAGDHAAEQALLIFAVVTGTAAMWGWLQRRPGLAGALSGAAFLIPAAVAYVAVINTLSGFLTPALPPSTLGLPAVWIVTSAVLITLGALGLTRWAPAADQLHRTLYVNALGAGHTSVQHRVPADPTSAPRTPSPLVTADTAGDTAGDTTADATADSVAIEARRAQLRTAVTLAARVVPTHYPLETFIAVNPLAGLEGLPFEQALRRAGDLYGMPGTLGEPAFRQLYAQGRITDADLDGALMRRYPNLAAERDLRVGEATISALELLRADLLHGTGAPAPTRRFRTRSEERAPEVAEAVDAQTSKWCAAFFGGAAWPMPDREDGFYAAWRGLAARDRSVSRAVRADLCRAAARPDDAVAEALNRLGVDDEARIPYLHAHLTRMPGWAAHVQWCSGRDGGVDVLAYLAMRLTYEAAMLAHHRGGGHTRAEVPVELAPARQRAARLIDDIGLAADGEDELVAVARVLTVLPSTARETLWQNAFEAHYRDRLLADLSIPRPATTGEVHTQLVSCIDTRSEGLRRHLEALSGYETLGFAGFFAVAIRYTDILRGASSDLCPVLIAPNHDITETAVPDADGAAARQVAGATRMAGAESAFHSAKEALAAPFTLAEAAGWAAAPLSAAKTLTPAISAGIRRRLRDALAPEAPTQIDLAAMPHNEQVLFAEVALTTMGLTTGFGRLVVLCAHGSTTENNPYQASLDCGACGGQGGAPNARTAAAILNRAQVRAGLRSVGIDIPAETLFVAAQHDTAVDRVTILDRHLVPADHRADLQRLDRDLATAGARLATERCTVLPGATGRLSAARAARHVSTRSSDWAQVYPEWGLAGNAAFIVAPRDVTAGIDLKRRTFLHSYVSEVDIDGSALETILTAPLVVAQWINCQYYFSTVAPEVFGAGTKTIHNVVGSVGVIAGHTGDLQLGLPWQSVSDGMRLLHEPQRLLAVVQAPLERIDEIVERNPILQQLFGNDWVALTARENAEEPWQRWTRSGWCPWADSSEHVHPSYDKEMVP